MKIAVLGAGKMGLSFCKSFLKYDLIQPENLHLVTRNSSKIDEVQKLFPKSKVSAFEDFKDIDADLLILSVKPQDFNKISNELPFEIPTKTIVLSIMAGITIENLQKILQHQKIVRAMPNSPTLLGMGITGYTASEQLDRSELMQIERLLNSTGRSIYIEEEKFIDSVTALSGSGPAYFYYIIDAMVKAGVEMGLQENLSKLLVEQTMVGAYHLINSSEKSLTELIQDVASKGGTTEAALKVFAEKKLDTTLIEGILAAENRAQELSK